MGQGKQEVVEGAVRESKLSQKWSFIMEERTAGAKGQVTERSTLKLVLVSVYTIIHL